jgi:hypothetical protein
MRLNPLTQEYIGESEAAIRRFEEIVIDESDRDVRLHGRFRYLSGRVWKMWDRHVHTIDRKRWVAGEKGVIIDGQPPQQWPRMMIIDPHDEKPHAILWVAKEPEYQLYYAYREAWLKDKTFAQACEHIRDVEIENREKIFLRVMDPNFGPKQQGNTKTTVRDTFEQDSNNIGFPMRFAFGDDSALGRKKVEEMLWYNTEMPISAINQPYFYVCNDLPMCIYQIEHYVWPDTSVDKPDPMIAQPVKKHDDFPACIRYMSLFNWAAKPAEILRGDADFQNTGGN